MKFSEFEKLMKSRGISSLAEIARNFKTSPQAVSNWKSRDQVPLHVENKVEKLQLSTQIFINNDEDIASAKNLILSDNFRFRNFEDAISLYDVFLKIAEQFKTTILIMFLSVFFAFTYAQFIKTPLYESKATVLLPEKVET